MFSNAGIEIVDDLLIFAITIDSYENLSVIETAGIKINQIMV